MAIFTQTANILAPFLYQLRLTNILSQTQQALAREIDFSTPSINTLNPIINKICDVLLIEKAHILIQNNSSFDTYVIKGHNYGNGFSKTFSSTSNISIKVTQSDNLVSHFRGVTEGESAIEIKKENRFDYLHCKYNIDSDEMEVEVHTPQNSRQVEKSLIKNYNSSRHRSIQSIYKKVDNDGLGMKETIVFPLVYSLGINNKFSSLPIIGFVITHNRAYRPLGRNWENIVQILSQAISVGISCSDQLFTKKSEEERIVRHEIRAYTVQIVQMILDLKGKAHWLLRSHQNKNEKEDEELRTLSALSKGLEDIHEKIIPELHIQLELLRAMPILQRLGVSMDAMPEIINVTNQIKDTLKQFAHEKNNRGIFVNYELLRDFNIEIHKSALSHIVTNILSNAFKYAKANSIFEIYVDPTNEYKISFRNYSLCAENDDSSTRNLIRMGHRGEYHKDDVDGEGVGLGIVQILTKIFLMKEFSYDIGEIETKHNQHSGESYWTRAHTITLDFSNIAIKRANDE